MCRYLVALAFYFVLSFLCANACVYPNESSKLFVKNSHFFKLPDGALSINDEPTSAEYLVGFLEGRMSQSISDEFRDLITTSICGGDHNPLRRSLSEVASKEARNLLTHSNVVLESKTLELTFDPLFEPPVHPMASIAAGADDSVYVCVHGSDLHLAAIEKFDASTKQSVWRAQLNLGYRAIEGSHRCNTLVLCGPHEVAVVGVTEAQILVAFFARDDGSLVDKIELSY